ncbi:UDP-N-acetylmuramoyl-L-alanyl-D-glutamate--2,6-diaminopimelate ligase [Chloroflexus sp.]|uniref:UDP-N-acetylmuramoyl-L-alanyl-D-glutamate--2, 6-diaminopimelate ligase n=1 Tax=Chloroflexus sp. TaxID=1904827 RepID=UPI00261F10E3|nr:UDP-N-acetylmuramoyl-L-alanyl-D-glutamate--2,6-diaminopimelate ligase [uncultured Chloroflexus sp.]
MTKPLAELLPGVIIHHLIGDPAVPIHSLTYDSRRVEPGSLFVAIRGQHSDGHQFIDQALARGAVALVVDQRHWHGSAPADVPVVVVADSRVALAPLAAAFYGHPGREMITIGITGTKGKSTTTDLTTQLLAAAGRNVGMISTVDFQIGTRRWANDTRQSTPEAPEVQALLREMVTAGCDTAVIEATSHALSPRWGRLVGCAFAVAVMLNIGHEHLDYHGSFEQYRADKCQLFALLAEREGSTWAIVNADDPNHSHFLSAAPATAIRLRYGLQEPAEVRGQLLRSGPTGSLLQVDTPWGAAEMAVPLPGRFNASNVLAAVTVALTQGVSLDQVAAAVAGVRAPRGRMVPVHAGQPFDVIVDYAHNPDSFTQIFAMLRPQVQGRMIAVFGSAGERDVAKRAIQGEIAGRMCDLLVLTDEDPRGEDREAIIAQIAAGAEQAGKRAGSGYLCIPDRAQAIRAAFAAARPGDLVLLLGKGHEGSIIYADHSLPWDEEGEARRALAELGYGAL